MGSCKVLYLFIFIINFVQYCSSNEINYKVIKINDGLIRGIQEKTMFEQKEFYAFRGIPFAHPPIGEKRFMLPELPEPWDDILETTKYQNYCPQVPNIGVAQNTVIGNEDCLYLNVYSPDLNPTANLPVMVNIHGGGFNEGNGDDVLYGPDFLINEDIVYVSINYRLGILGFMSMGTEMYSGNNGLKDQVMALQWVKENIHHFGGNKNHVTIFGESAGGACTHYHILSPLSKNLFNRAIAQSGSALHTWSYHENNHQQILFEFAKKNGQNFDNVDDLVNYLKIIDFKELISEFRLVYQRDIQILFAPVIEDKSVKSAFITELPEEIIRKKTYNKCDVIFGYTANEFLIFSGHDMEDENSMKKFNKDFEVLIPRKEFMFDFSSKEYRLLASEIRQFYFGDAKIINNDTFVEYIDLLSDVFFIYGIDRSAKLHSLDDTHKIFYYRFSMEADLNAGKEIKQLQEKDGTSHIDELCYLFSCNFYTEKYKSLKEDSVEFQGIKMMTKMWTNFAKNGNPTSDGLWKPITKNDLNFIDIRNEGIIPALNPHSKYIKFWNNLFKKYNYLLAEKNRKNLNDEL